METNKGSGAKDELPPKLRLESHRETIWDLRNKGYSWREIADYLKSKGVATDHMKVYRLMTKDSHRGLVQEAKLLTTRAVGLVVIGGSLFESRPGRPLRPYSEGRLVAVKEKIRIIALEDADRAYSAWCEAQFRLSEPAGYDWLRTLHEELMADWNPECPHYIRSRLGFDVKFEGDVMAILCRDFQLKNDFGLLNDAIRETNSTIMRADKNLHKQLAELNKARHELIASQHATVDESLDETLEGYADWYRKRDADLSKAFKDLDPS